jgi:hypothetical protein
VAFALGLALAMAVEGLTETAPLAWLEPEAVGSMPAGRRETSGVAVSRRDGKLLWTHGDSGGEPVLDAIAGDGALRGKLRIAGVKNEDWEDLASFELDGRAWLLIADTGDNKAGRGECSLLVVEEPAADKLAPEVERIANVAWRIPVIYPDGPRDVEAVAVDVRAERVYLLAKRTKPHGLYVLPLRPTPPGRPMAPMERVGEIASFPAAEGAEALLPTARGAYRAQPTGMDFAADGSAAVIVTYGDVLLYSRNGDEAWAAALARPPLRLTPHGLAQAEAVCFGAATGTDIYVTSEGKAAALLRYGRRR